MFGAEAWKEQIHSFSLVKGLKRRESRDHKHELKLYSDFKNINTVKGMLIIQFEDCVGFI